MTTVAQRRTPQPASPDLARTPVDLTRAKVREAFVAAGDRITKSALIAIELEAMMSNGKIAPAVKQEIATQWSLFVRGGAGRATAGAIEYYAMMQQHHGLPKLAPPAIRDGGALGRLCYDNARRGISDPRCDGPRNPRSAADTFEPVKGAKRR